MPCCNRQTDLWGYVPAEQALSVPFPLLLHTFSSPSALASFECYPFQMQEVTCNTYLGRMPWLLQPCICGTI